jgi:hypothetical protein
VAHLPVGGKDGGQGKKAGATGEGSNQDDAPTRRTDSDSSNNNSNSNSSNNSVNLTDPMGSIEAAGIVAALETTVAF